MSRQLTGPEIAALAQRAADELLAGMQRNAGTRRHFEVVFTLIERHPDGVRAASSSSMGPKDTASVLRTYLAKLEAIGSQEEVQS